MNLLIFVLMMIHALMNTINIFQKKINVHIIVMKMILINMNIKIYVIKNVLILKQNY